MSGSQSPARWYAHMPHPAVTGRLSGATLRCFDGTDPVIEQPALDENVVAIHLGGAKRVHRWQGRHYRSWDVPANAITLMPAFRANRWQTEGASPSPTSRWAGTSWRGSRARSSTASPRSWACSTGWA